MSGEFTQKEAKLASERNQNIRDALKKKRFVSLVVVAACLVAGVVAAIVGFGMVAFCLVVVALISLLTYFDANSHLHEVSLRSKKTLAPNFSLLERKGEQADADQNQPMAHD